MPPIEDNKPFPETPEGDEAAKNFAITVLQNGMEFGAEISSIVAPLAIHPFTRMAGFMAAAVVASISARKADAKEENRETLHLMLDILVKHCEDARGKAEAERNAALAQARKGMI
jgi:hypothetical protein